MQFLKRHKTKNFVKLIPNLLYRKKSSLIFRKIRLIIYVCFGFMILIFYSLEEKHLQREEIKFKGRMSNFPLFAQCLGQFSSFVEHKIFMLKRVNELFFFYISLTLQIWSLPIVIKSIFVLKNIVSLVVYMFAW